MPIKLFWSLLVLVTCLALLGFLSLATPPAAHAAGAWTNVGTAGFSAGSVSRTSLALDGSTPYVAFRDGANSEKATVMKFDGANWVNVGSAGFSADMAFALSLALDGSTPYVAFEDIANIGRATVMKFDGTNWVNVGSPGFSPGSADDISIAFDGSTPYVAFVDGANSFEATVMKFDGIDWVNVGSPGFSPGFAGTTSLVFDGTTPYVAFQDGANSNKATVMKFNGTDWVNVGPPDFSSGAAGYLSLALHAGTPYVAFAGAGYTNKAAVMKFDGTNWVNVGIDGFSPGNVIYTSLEFDGSTPYVAFGDDANGYKATVMKFNGTSWVNVGSADFSAGSAFYTSLAMDGSTPYVAFQDGGNSFKATVMKFVDPQAGPTFVVNDSTDTDDGTCENAPQDCTLREAITAANALAGADTITFDIPLMTGCTAANVCTITLGTTLPAINDDATIDGSANSAKITVSGGDLHQVMVVNSSKTLHLDSLTIAHGFCGICNGGGILNKGTLYVTNSTFSGNKTNTGLGLGGAVHNVGTAYVNNSTFTGNYVTGTDESHGGAISNDGTLNVTNSTFSQNQADRFSCGGGIYNTATLNVLNSTLSGNLADGGGGICNGAGTITLKNTIVANSTGGDCERQSGTVNAQNSLVEGGLSCVNGTNSNNLTGDPALGALADNGGSTQTMALGNSSVAIDAADSTVCVDINVNNLDQRGQARNDLRCDVGAFELVNSDGHTVVRDNLAVGETYTFGPTLAQLLLDSGYTGTLSVNRELTPPLNNPPANALPITWDATIIAGGGGGGGGPITSAATTQVTGFSLMVTLCYDKSVLTGQNENTLHVYHYNGTSWDDLGGTLDTLTHAPYDCITATTPLTSLSPIAIAPAATTAVNVRNVSAHVGKLGNITLRWRTTSESQIAGFNVYRKNGQGEWKQINTALVPARHSGDLRGSKYAFKDRDVREGKTYRYKVEVIYLDQHTEWTDIVKVQTP